MIDEDRVNAIAEIVREALITTDSISLASNELILAASKAGLTPSDIERAIAWWRGEDGN